MLHGAYGRRVALAALFATLWALLACQPIAAPGALETALPPTQPGGAARQTPAASLEPTTSQATPTRAAPAQDSSPAAASPTPASATPINSPAPPQQSVPTPAPTPTPPLNPTPTASPTPAKPRGQPNIVFILTDDQAKHTLSVMPKVEELLTKQGASFSQFLASVSLCCPARVSILRGQYAHNTEIWGNNLPWGGFPKFHKSGMESETIATQLQAAGYRTGFVGKYLNAYPNGAAATYVPPGWDYWASPSGGLPYSGYNYTLNENGRLVSYGNHPKDYGTDVYADKAVDFVRQAAAAGQPFFLHVSLLVPHQSATPALRHVGMFSDVPLPQPPSFNEGDVSDKPQFIRSLPPLPDSEIARLENFYRKQLRSLQAVDELVENMVKALEETGQMDNTYIVFTSDHGFHIGEHRLPDGKQTAYEEDILIPFIVRGPGIAPGTEIDYLAGNVDIAPTISQWAGLEPLPFTDGRSLAPLLQPRPPAESSWRQVFLLEKGSPAANGIPPPYRGVRTRRHTYVEYETGERELYDLRQDPYQLQNIVDSADPQLVERLSALLQQLRECKTDACRQAEQQPAP